MSSDFCFYKGYCIFSSELNRVEIIYGSTFSVLIHHGSFNHIKLKTICVGVQIRENPEPLEYRGKFYEIKNRKKLCESKKMIW